MSYVPENGEFPRSPSSWFGGVRITITKVSGTCPYCGPVMVGIVTQPSYPGTVLWCLTCDYQHDTLSRM